MCTQILRFGRTQCFEGFTQSFLNEAPCLFNRLLLTGPKHSAESADKAKSLLARRPFSSYGLHFECGQRLLLLPLESIWMFYSSKQLFLITDIALCVCVWEWMSVHRSNSSLGNFLLMTASSLFENIWREQGNRKNTVSPGLGSMSLNTRHPPIPSISWDLICPLWFTSPRAVTVYTHKQLQSHELT